MKRHSTFEREVINTYQQLQAATTGVGAEHQAIAITFSAAHSVFGPRWQVVRIVRGRNVKTDHHASWHDYGRKTFLGNKRSDASERAKAWVAGQYGEHGPWKRNRMGEWVPERINNRFPLRKQ